MRLTTSMTQLMALWLGTATFGLVATTAHAGDGVSFPRDFPDLVDAGGLGIGRPLSGRGGDLALDRAGHRAAVHKRPVILVHGNGSSATSARWGFAAMREHLLDAGYAEAEIWAPSYLGEGNSSVDLMDPHRNNVEDVRAFVDAVRTYLGVDKVDIVAHSLGAGIAKAYLNGYTRAGTWDQGKTAYDHVGTFVALAAGFYGLGPFSQGEFRTGSSFEQASHAPFGVTDDTPHGSSSEGEHTTPLDDDRITYVALWATGDFVDGQHAGTGRLEGADLNQGFNLGPYLTGHERIIKDADVFTTFLPYLNR